MQPLLISFLDGHPKVLSTSSSFRYWSDDSSQVLVQGDIFRLGATSFSGPRDEATLPHLLRSLRTDSLATWKSLLGQCSCIFVTSDRIELYRSPFSPYLLFYTGYQVSNQCAALLSTGFSFSEEYLQKFVADYPSLQFSAPLTPFEGVYRLPPHTVLRFGAGGLESHEALPFEVFDLVESTTSVSSTAGALRDTLEQVLQWHLKKTGNLAAELSGGLDSSFVASFLADLKPNALSALMYSYRKNPSHAFSERCADLVAREKHIALKIIDSAPLERIDISLPAPYQNEPIDFFWQGLLFGRICQDFVPEGGLLFTGFGCDQLFMRNHAIVEALFHKKGFWKAWPVVKSIAQSLNRPILNFAFQYLISLLPPKVLVRLMDATRNLTLNPLKIDELVPQINRFDRVSWMRSQKKGNPAVLLWDWNEQGHRQESRFFPTWLPHSNLNYLVAPQYVIGPYLEAKQVTYIHPFCDSRLIEFAFRAVPYDQIHDFKSPYKHLLREAQKGITPEAVRTREKDEFSFDGFFYSILKTNEDFLRELLEEAIASYPDWIEPEAIRKSFEALLFGSYSNSEVKLSRLISYLVWKKNFLTLLERNSSP